MPEIRIVDMKDLRRKRIIKDSNFSPLLVESIHEALETNGQVILFQNRRGFSPFVECQECGWVPRCMNCDVSLTYHKYHNELVCHYCGHKILAPKKCPECGHEGLRTVGAGTEKIEEEIQKQELPDLISIPSVPATPMSNYSRISSRERYRS